MHRLAQQVVCAWGGEGRGGRAEGLFRSRGNTLPRISFGSPAAVTVCRGGAYKNRRGASVILMSTRRGSVPVPLRSTATHPSLPHRSWAPPSWAPRPAAPASASPGTCLWQGGVFRGREGWFEGLALEAQVAGGNCRGESPSVPCCHQPSSCQPRLSDFSVGTTTAMMGMGGRLHAALVASEYALTTQVACR